MFVQLYREIRICGCFLLLIVQIVGSRIRRKALQTSLYSQMRWKWESDISIHLFQSISLRVSVFSLASFLGGHAQRTSSLARPFREGKVKPQLNVKEEDIQLVKV